MGNLPHDFLAFVWAWATVTGSEHTHFLKLNSSIQSLLICLLTAVFQLPAWQRFIMGSCAMIWLVSMDQSWDISITKVWSVLPGDILVIKSKLILHE